jgi:hypothetical protein
MKRTRLATVLGIAAVAVPAGAAVAAVTAKGPVAQKLGPGQAVTYGGVTCTTYAGTTATNANIVCVRNNLKGYGVVVSQDTVVVAKQVNGKVVVAFRKPNK